MPDEVSLYEAKAQLSALVRQVRGGRRVVITVHGEPAAELRPVDPSTRRSIADRLAELEARGVVAPARRAPGVPRAFAGGAKSRGALARFLAERE